jgi:hypothetical protein
MRDASGDVMRIGQAIAHGYVADSPLGRRRYESEIEMWEYLASKSLGQNYVLTLGVPSALPEMKTKPSNAQLRKAKRKPAKKK